MNNFIVVKIIILALTVMFQLAAIQHICLKPYGHGIIPLWLSLMLTLIMIFVFAASFLFANEIVSLLLNLLKIG